MAKIRSGFLSFLKALWDNDRDTGIEVERTADDDTVRVHAGGNTDIVKVTSLKVHVNADGRAVAIQFDGDGKSNVFYLDPTNDGVVMGGTNSTFVRSGSTVRSVFLALKPNEANWNAGAQAVYTNEALRAADFTLFKSGGTEGSPTAIGAASDITNIRIEGYSGASGLAIAAVIRGASDGTVSDAVVPGAMYISVADAAGALQQMLALRSSGNIGTNGRGTPLSGFDLGSSLGLTRRAVAANTSTTATDVIIATTSTTAARTHTLRTADTVGRRFYIFSDESGNAGTNNITIDTEGTQLIDGQATATIKENNGFRILYCNGSNWFTVAKSVDVTENKVARLNAATLTLTRQNQIVVVDYTVTGAVTLTLPAASTMWDSTLGTGKQITIKDGGCNASVNNITINRAGSDTILSDVTGDTSVTINGNGDSITITAVSATEYAII